MPNTPSAAMTDSDLLHELDGTEKAVLEWLDNLFPRETFGFVGDKFRNATAIRITETVRTLDKKRVN